MSLAKEIGAQEINSVRHEALLNIVRTSDFIGKLSSKFFGKFGLTEAQYNVLIILKLNAKSLTQVEIGKKLISSRANITSLVDRLEKKNYVERKKDDFDRRLYKVNLTKEGLNLLEKVEPTYVNEVEKRMASINESDCRKLSAILVKFRQNLGD